MQAWQSDAAVLLRKILLLEAEMLQQQKKAATGILPWTLPSVSREDGSGTRGAFIELFGIEEEVDGEKVDMTTEGAQITNSTSVMMTTVAGDEYAIGYVSLWNSRTTV